MKKLIYSVIVAAVLIGGYIMVSQLQTGDDLGSVTIKVIDENGITVIDETHSFDHEMTLFDLINSQYNVGCAGVSYSLDTTCDHSFIYGHVVLSIEGVVTDWTNSYIKIIIDDVDSNYGIDSIYLEDGVIYTLIYTEVGGDGS